MADTLPNVFAIGNRFTVTVCIRINFIGIEREAKLVNRSSILYDDLPKLGTSTSGMTWNLKALRAWMNTMVVTWIVVIWWKLRHARYKLFRAMPHMLYICMQVIVLSRCLVWAPRRLLGRRKEQIVLQRQGQRWCMRHALQVHLRCLDQINGWSNDVQRRPICYACWELMIAGVWSHHEPTSFDPRSLAIISRNMLGHDSAGMPAGRQLVHEHV